MCAMTEAIVLGARSVWSVPSWRLSRSTPSGVTGARTELTVRAGAMEKTSYIRTRSIVNLAVRGSLGSTGEASVEWEMEAEELQEEWRWMLLY